MNHPKAQRGSAAPLIGVLPGEGCGPELTSHALDMLAAASPPATPAVELGPPTGKRALAASGTALPADVVSFCRGIFDRGGAILAGAAGDRFVYDARREFGLSAKLNPIHSFPELGDCGRFRPSPEPVDLIVVRENLGDLYQGHLREDESDDAVITVAFPTRHADIAEVTSLAARLAGQRRNRMTLVTKEAGLPELHRTWLEHARAAAATFDVRLDVIDVDAAAYLLLRQPESFDVIATSNCFGDILSDLGGHIMGSRGNTYGASYSPDGIRDLPDEPRLGGGPEGNRPGEPRGADPEPRDAGPRAVRLGRRGRLARRRRPCHMGRRDRHPRPRRPWPERGGNPGVDGRQPAEPERITRMRTCLIAVDLQAGFLDDPEPRAGGRRAPRRGSEVAGAIPGTRPSRRPRPHHGRPPSGRPAFPHWDERRRRTFAPGAPGWAFAPQAAPREDEPIVDKTHYSGFESGRLPDLLAELEVQEVVRDRRPPPRLRPQHRPRRVGRRPASDASGSTPPPATTPRTPPRPGGG